MYKDVMKTNHMLKARHFYICKSKGILNISALRILMLDIKEK